MTLTMALLEDIEAFLEANPISATALGNLALGDRHFVRQLRMGRRVWPETEKKVRAFMTGFPDQFAPEVVVTANVEQSSPGKGGENFPSVSVGGAA